MSEKFSHIQMKDKEDLRSLIEVLKTLGLKENLGLMTMSINYLDAVFSAPDSNIFLSTMRREFCSLGLLPTRVEVLRGDP